ncbi:putative glycerol uptake protein, partial [Leptomonas seymouri]
MRRPVPGTPEFLCGPELSSLSALTDSQDGSTSHRSFRSSFTQARNEEGLALIRIPSSLHAESPAMKNGYELNGPTSTALTGPRRWKFSSLSLTTNIDAGAADNTTASLRFLSLEYLLCVLIELCFCVYGFVLLKGFCKREAHTYLHDLQHPFSGLVWLDSTGYDNKVDKQWSGFLYQYPTLICLALLLGLSSSVLRCVSSFNGSPSSTTAQSDAALSSSDDCPSGGAEYSDDEDLDKRCSNGALTLRQHTSRLARLCAAPLQWLCSLVADCWLLPVLYTVVGVIFIAVVHGPHFFLPILLIAANYVVFTRLQRWCPYWAFMAIMWVVHTGLLYIIELYAGFEGTYWLQYLFPTSFESTFNVLGPRFGRPGLWRQHMRWCVAF